MKRYSFAGFAVVLFCCVAFAAEPMASMLTQFVCMKAGVCVQEPAVVEFVKQAKASDSWVVLEFPSEGAPVVHRLTLERGGSLPIKIDPVVPTPVDPVVDPTPIPKAGFRVLIIEQEASRASLPRGQLGVLQSTKVREYAMAKCAKGPDGKTPEYRVIDVDSDASLLPQVWRDALARPRTSLPWLIVSDGVKGESIPLPASEDEMLAVLKKYGG